MAFTLERDGAGGAGGGDPNKYFWISRLPDTVSGELELKYKVFFFHIIMIIIIMKRDCSCTYRYTLAKVASIIQNECSLFQPNITSKRWEKFICSQTRLSDLFSK